MNSTTNFSKRLSLISQIEVIMRSHDPSLHSVLIPPKYFPYISLTVCLLPSPLISTLFILFITLSSGLRTGIHVKYSVNIFLD